MKHFLHSIAYAAFYALSRLPYGVLYFISDLFYPLVYYVARYRRTIVRHNITTAMPDKSLKECIKIEKEFYRWLCDYFVEALKLMSVSRQELLRHIEFRNAEEIEQCFDNGQTCAAILGHYCNWELLSATGLSFKTHTEAVCGLIYHPLRNHLFDRIFIKLRQSMGGVCIPKKDILRYLVQFKRQKVMSLFGYIADQSPNTRTSTCGCRSSTTTLRCSQVPKG